VLPFYQEHQVPLLRVLTDRGTEYRGKVEQHDWAFGTYRSQVQILSPRPLWLGVLLATSLPTQALLV